MAVGQPLYPGWPGNPLDNMYTENKYAKKYQVVETNEDILALSVTWHRLRPLFKDSVPRPASLIDLTLFKALTQADRDKATLIRDHYSKKIMMLTLRDQRLSNFRKDLSTFIHGSKNVIKEELMPLIYRLPEFYEYDIEIERMFSTLDKVFEDTTSTAAVTLKPLKKIVVNHKTNKFSEYWLEANNRAYKIEIPIENKLNHLWEHFFEQESIPLTGYIRYLERDGLNFYQLKNWEIDFSKI